jgi:hypothetical protein
VGHEPETLSDVERADTTSRQTTRPDGVTFFFHVIANTVEPSVSNRCFNLLTKDDWRPALGNELEPDRPKVAGIVSASLGACGRERLTGTTPRPDSAVVGPSGQSKSVGPAANPSEEVTLGEASHVVGLNKGN